MKGLATIDLPAHGTDSYLGEFGMLLSKQARSVAIPSLEIDQPDCRRVAHASSVGPIDETQLFYLESRGLDPGGGAQVHRPGLPGAGRRARAARVGARDRLRELLEAKWDARSDPPPGRRRGLRRRAMGPPPASRRIDLCAADDVPPGTMKLCEVEDELVLVTNLDGTVPRHAGRLLARVLRAGSGFLTGDSITCARSTCRASR
jgi:hypothetical protein